MKRVTGKWLILWSVLACLFTLLQQKAEAASQSWLMVEKQCYGEIECMVERVKAAPNLNHYRSNRSPEELFEVLKSADRFSQLGLTEAEGWRLIEAVYEKLSLGQKKGSQQGGTGKKKGENRGALSYDFRAGQEFESLRGMLMRWPFDWSSHRANWARMVSILSNANLTVYMWVNTTTQRDDAIAYLLQHGVETDHIVWVVETTDSIWMRDYAPSFIYDNHSDNWGVVDFHYYNGRPNDDDTPIVVAAAARVPKINRQTNNVVYTEGGNLNHDGLGAIVYSQRTYDQNPGVEQEIIDQRIMSAFQAHNNIVPAAPSLDSTGHVDMFMKIVNEATVLVAEYQPDQTDYHILEEGAMLMASSTNGAGEPWEVIRIPQPDVTYIFFVIPVVRTYTNSIIANNVVIVPSYGLETDGEALAIYRQLFPEKEIHALDAEDIIISAGAWHCVVMEYPNPANPD